LNINDSICDQSQPRIGDRLIINPQGINYEIPVLESEAQQLGYEMGSCMDTMGTHWFKDITKSDNHMSWKSENVLPIVPMYNNGTINAIFFNTDKVQQGLFDAHWWEPIPLINSMMCMNMCDSKCTFSGTCSWSTMHIYFNDPKQVKCDRKKLDCGLLGTACCPK